MIYDPEIAAVQADIARIAAESPGQVVFAMLEVLVDVACGDNPALADYKRLQLYRGVRHKLAQKGIR